MYRVILIFINFKVMSVLLSDTIDELLNTQLTRITTTDTFCSNLFGTNYGFMTKINTKKINFMKVFYNVDFICSIHFVTDDNDTRDFYPKNELKNVTEAHIDLRNSLIVGIFIQSEIDYIKSFQLNIQSLTSNATYWTPLFGKIEFQKPRLYTYLFYYINYIRSIVTYTNTDHSFLSGFKIYFSSRNCFSLLTTTSIPMVTETSFIIDSLLNLSKEPINVITGTNVNIDESNTSSTTRLGSLLTSASVTDSLIITKEQYCSNLFGSNNGNSVEPRVHSINIMRIFFNDDCISNIHFFYDDNTNYTLFQPTDTTNIKIVNVNLMQVSIVGIYIQNKDDYIKCFKLKLLNLTSNTISWTPLFGQIENGNATSLKTYLFNYINDIYSIETILNLQNISYPILGGFKIKFSSEICFPLLITTTFVPIVLTTYTMTNSSTTTNQLIRLPITVLIFSISIPLAFIFVLIIVCYLNYRYSNFF